MNKNKLRRAVGALAIAAGGIGLPLALAGTAGASTTASLGVVGGTLSFVTPPGNITFPSLDLTGSDQTTSQALPLDVDDSTGSGNGWQVDATSTTFTNVAGDVLPDTAVTIASAPTATCDVGSSCVLPVTSVEFPYALPAGATAPTATPLFDAAIDTGMGSQSFSPEFTLALPGNAYSGTYTSTWSISLVSGPAGS